MKKNLKELIANIIKAVNGGENTVLVIVDSITEEEIKEIHEKTGIKNIKDITPYYRRQTVGKTEEYEKFLTAAFDSHINKFIYKSVFLEDGSIGTRMERLPLYVVIYTTDWQRSYREKSISNLNTLKRHLPSFYYRTKKTSKIVFTEAVQYIRPSDFYSPYFRLEDITLDELYADLEEIGTKDVGDGVLHLFQSKKNPYMYRFYKEQKEDSYDHPAGYHWSSRSAVINAAFGTKIMEVTICETPYSQCTCAIAADKVAELIPFDYEIVEVEEHGELVYEMKKKANNQ